MIHHGAFEHVAAAPRAPLPAPLDQVDEPVVLFFGLVRPYKGVDTLLQAWRGITGAELWVVGRPMIDMGPLRAAATGSVRFVDRYVPEHEVQAYFRRADVIVLPYERTERFDQSGVLATALAFGKPVVLTDIGGFPEVAATGAGRLVAAGDADALREALQWLIDDPAARARLGQAATQAARRPVLVGVGRAADARAVPLAAVVDQAETGAALSPAGTALASRRATSARTTGATSVPNSSIERSTSAWLTAPTDIWPT